MPNPTEAIDAHEYLSDSHCPSAAWRQKRFAISKDARPKQQYWQLNRGTLALQRPALSLGLTRRRNDRNDTVRDDLFEC